MNQELFADPTGVAAQDVLDHVDPADLPTEQWPLILQSLVDIFSARLRRRGRPDDEALKLARELVFDQANYQGGRQMYIPTGERLKIALRDDEIWRRYRPGRADIVAQLAREHRLTERQIWSIVRRQRAIAVARRQGALFENAATR